jgi:putative drug exporter of the RND superfamily
MEGLLASLGRFCAEHARMVVVAWAIAIAAAWIGAGRLPQLLLSGSGEIPGSASLRVDELLRRDFADPRSDLLVLALRSPSLDRRLEDVLDLLDEIKERWKRDPLAAEVQTDGDLADKRLRPAPGTGHIVLVSLKSGREREAEEGIQRFRSTAEPLLLAARARHPDLEWAITGRAALAYDLNRFNAEDTAKAELRAMPLALVVLVLAFGSLLATGLPVVVGWGSMTLALGLVSIVAQSTVVSNMVPGVASMIGLALGIDYSLFMIHRYREGGLEHAMASAGPVVLYSGLTVFIGMAGLIFTPLVETRSLGIGGCLVVAMSVMLALTLLPAMLALLGSAALEWPRALSTRLRGQGRARWRRWADLVTRYPLAGAIGGLAIVLLLAAPALQTSFGFPEAGFLPPELEYARGLGLLDTMDLKGFVSPLPVVLEDADGGKALTTERVPALLAFSARLRSDPRVATVLGPVDLAEGWPASRYLDLYSDVDAAFALSPRLRSQYVGVDQRRILMLVIPSRDCTLEQTKELARAIPAWMRIPGMQIHLGGQPQHYNDLDTAVKSAYAGSVAFVLIATWVLLLVVFRAPLVAAKALLLNVLSVLAGYGAVVYVFQLGHGSSWLGVAAPTEVVPITIPLLIFCILFGLSMDYEMFLLSRVRAAFLRTGDNTASVREAVADTGSVITSAALIMVAVFGAFAAARVVLVQMLALGLAVAVLVDAVVIRSLLGPALMVLAGRWNWWPR